MIRKLTERAERLTRRAETLEDWIENNRPQFERLGINGLPSDVREDRTHDEDDLLEELET